MKDGVSPCNECSEEVVREGQVEGVARAPHVGAVQESRPVRVVLQEALLQLGEVLEGVLLQLLLDDGNQGLQAELVVPCVAIVTRHGDDLVLGQKAASQLNQQVPVHKRRNNEWLVKGIVQ